MCKDTWYKVLPIWRVGQHNKCNDCAKNGLMMKQPQCQSDRDNVITAYITHPRRIFQDRAVLRPLSKGNAATDGSDHLLLNVDGVVEGKVQGPKNAGCQGIV